MANRKREQGRKKYKRHSNKKIIILCEGEKTEINYFKHFRKRGSLVEVIPKPSNGNTAVKKLISYALNKGKWREWNFSPGEGDLIWCVYDKDQNTDTDMHKAYGDSKKKNFMEVYPSNPCFEVWYLFHFINHATIGESRTPQEIKKKMKKYIRGYSESMDVYDILISQTQSAIDKVRKRFGRITKEEKEDHSKGLLDPSTNIPFLIEQLNKFLKN